MIKRIGTAARLEIQKFFGTRVFLDLVVKVAPDWRENERVLDDLGIAGTRRKGTRPGRRQRREAVTRRAEPEWIYNTAAKRAVPAGRARAAPVPRRSMPLHTADALILRTYKLGEADRIVVFLTRDRGKKRGVAKSARRLRSRFAGRARTVDARLGGLLREGEPRAGVAELRRHRAVAAVGLHPMRSATPATSRS